MFLPGKEILPGKKYLPGKHFYNHSLTLRKPTNYSTIYSIIDGDIDMKCPSDICVCYKSFVGSAMIKFLQVFTKNVTKKKAKWFLPGKKLSTR